MKKQIIRLLIIIIILTHPFYIYRVEAEESIILKLWNLDSIEPRRTITHKEIEHFNQFNPTIDIDNIRIDNEAYRMNVKVALAGNKMPNIIYTWPGELFTTMIEAGALSDLSNKVKFFLGDNFHSSFFKTVTHKNKIYGIPISFDGVVIWYNKRIFKENRLEIPGNWLEFMEIVDELDKKGITPITIGGQDDWPIIHWFSYLSQRIGGKDLLDKAIKGEVPLTHSVFVEAAAMLRNLLLRGGGPEDFLEIDSLTARNQFNSGQAAMYMQGAGYLESILDENANEDIDFFPFPVIDGGLEQTKMIYGGVNGVLAISRQIETDTVFEFVKYILGMGKYKRIIDKKTYVSDKLIIDNGKPVVEDSLINKYINFLDKGNFFAYYSQQLDLNRSEKLHNAIRIILENEKVDIEYVLSKVR